jgi:hypothetical protein
MKFRYAAFGLAVAIGAVTSSAEDQLRADEARAMAQNSGPILLSNEPNGLTGKERLGRKWMDEQRIDNCKVPIDKRGTKPRGDCSHPRTT